MPMSAGSWPGDAMGDQQVSVMGVNELTDLMKSNMSFLLVDARPRDQYDRAHIPGAISVPLNDIPACASQMDKSQPIVTYCGNYHCPISTKAAVAFMKLGFINVRDYKGGIKELQELGYPTAYT